jgi:hypothetical protein
MIRVHRKVMMNRLVNSITNTARGWSHDNLKEYIKQLEGEVADLKMLLSELKQVERIRQKEINKKLESGPRSG